MRAEANSTSTAAKVLPIALISLFGLGLRLYQLGADSFWLDEAGVAYGARMESLGEMMSVVRSHVMAMPLDYLIVWLFGKISLDEGVLRLPAALWGSLSVPLAYLFARRMAARPAALLTALLLALAPLHVQYSQELRFYASLVFFHLLATLLLWDALQNPSPKRWAACALGCSVGVYFHPYVLFALANGLAWLALAPQRGEQARARRMGFVLTVSVALLAFLAGYVTFSASNTFDIPLMVFEQSAAQAVLSGLGWLPFSPGAPGLHWAWGLLMAAAQIAGMAAAVRSGARSPQAGLLYGLAIQTAAVFGADLMGRYFFSPRQLIFLQPALCFFAATGAYAAARQMGSRSRQAAVLTGIAALLAASAVPALAHYYRDDKGSTRALVERVFAEWQPGDSFLVSPGYEGFAYQYYVASVYGREDVAGRLWAVDWQQVVESAGWEGTLFLATPARLEDGQAEQLAALGFTPALRSDPQSRYARVLWVRRDTFQNR